MAEAEKASARHKPSWRVVSGPWAGEEARGWTKAEARAELKARYGLPSLPAGTKLVMQEEDGK